MAHAYTPGLRVTESALLRKRRLLPLQGEVHVAVGDAVSAEQVIAATALPGNIHSLNVAHRLGIEPREVPDSMLKGEGDRVEADEVIARSAGLLGLFKSSCVAPVTGTIESVSSVTGEVFFREPPIPVEVTAYVDGTVVELLPGEGAVVECHGAFVQGILGIGGEAHGPLRVLVEQPGQPLRVETVDEACRGAVLVGGSHADAACMERAAEVGAAGLVVGGVDQADLEQFMGEPLGVAITGQEDVGTTVIITEGFGVLDMAERTFAILKEREGRNASINGATQIRAGVIRPEVIVPEEAKEAVGAAEVSSGIDVGSVVRIIREPHFGRLATVSALPEQLQKIETEASVRVLEAELEGGERVYLPRANVELIQTG